MPDPRTDQIAREAARLIETGRSNTIDSAIRAAADNPHLRGAPLPGHGRVRKHAQAMSMQALGEAAYNQQRGAIWQVAEQLMSLFEQALPDAEILLVGRAAEGHIDAGVAIHIRLYTNATDGEIARLLVEHGYEEPTFKTADSRFGRLSQICLQEDALEIVLTRCPPNAALPADKDLFTGKPIETMDLTTLRRTLDKS
ncbi:MAG: hypothetical protein L0219_02445 [Phycisphaerales bacterium]|nr:hypothetical protein [Phycisphaerales bacterium]